MKNNDKTGLRGAIEQMSTERLDEMLQFELEKNPVDEAAVRLIVDILEERDQYAPIEMNDQIEAAWAKYQAQAPTKECPRFSLRNWPMRAVAAIATVAILLFIAMPQDAEAEGFWERLTRWTDSIFEFFAPGDTSHIGEEYVFQTDHLGLQQVYDTVSALGVTYPVVPMWLPEGFALLQCKTSELPSKTVAYACFSNGENTIVLDIAIRNAESPRQYSKDETDAKEYENGGVIHNILQNEDWWTALWTRDELECTIAIDCQEETLYKILKSIYAVEDN